MTDEETGASRNALAVLWGELLAVAAPVLAAVDPWRRVRLMRALGWDLLAVTGDDAAAVQDWVATIEPTLDALSEALADADSLSGLIGAGGAAAEAFGKLGALPPALQGKLPEFDGLAEELADDLVDHLILVYLRDRVPWTLPLLTLLGLLVPAAEHDPSPALPAGENPIRLPRRRDELRLDRIADVIGDPEAYFVDLYAKEGWDTQTKVEKMAGRILPRLASLLGALGVQASYGVVPNVGPDQGEAGRRLADALLRVRFSGPRTATGEPPSTALDAGWTPRISGGFNLGLASWDSLLTVILAPAGEVNVTGAIGSWNVATELSGSGPLIAINSAGVTVAGEESEVRFAAEVARIAAADEAGWVFGAPDGSHLAIGQLVLGARATLGTGRDDIALLLRAGRAELVVQPGDGDGLLRKLLPADGLRIAFDLGLGWSLRTGLHLAGAAALTAEYPMHLSRWGVHLKGLRIALVGDSAAGRVSLILTTHVEAEIGPFSANISNIGIRADLTFPSALPPGTDDGAPVGNLGAADLAPRFEPPNGMSLHFDQGFLRGGGYLFRDQPRGMYAGALQLAIDFNENGSTTGGFQVQLIAVLNTRNTDGSRIIEADGDETFSLLAVGSVQWSPGLMLFWGISLTGLGVVFGHNRRSNPEEIGKAARAGTLDHLLFPEDPVGRAPEIVATLSRLFPVDPSGTVIGAMARLDFLSGKVTVDLAVLVEFPAPVRILLLGKLVIDLGKLGKLQLHIAGVYDIDRKEVSLDAGLADSKLFGRPVSGEMALRAGWGERDHFTLAIGGFHPRMPYPARFPRLKRLTVVVVGDGKSIDGKSGNGVTISGYLALTGNSLQFGGEAFARFEAAGFLVEGRAWLDALVQFDPFWFNLEVGAVLSVKFRGTELLAVTAILGVSGPALWRFWGELRFKLLFIDVSTRWDLSGGEETADREPVSFNVTGLLAGTLKNPRTWQVRYTGVGGEPVTLQPVRAAPDVLVLAPDATLAVRQNVLPFDVDLQRFGTSRIEGPNRFRLVEVRAGGEGGVTGELGDPLTDDFAPGQFRDLTPEEQLTVPGFERLPAGATVSLPKGTALPDPQSTVFAGLSGDEAWDRVIIDDPGDGGRPMPARPVTALAARQPDRLLTLFASTGPAANARTRTTGTARFGGLGLGVADAGPSWVPGPRPRSGRRDRTAARTAARTTAEALPSATQAAALAPGGDRARLVRRRTVTVPYPTIALTTPRKVS